MQLAERMSRIGIESAFEVLVKARALEKQGKSVIHLEIGEPDFPTPAHIDTGDQRRALGEGRTNCGPTQGDPELRPVSPPTSRTRVHRRLDYDARLRDYGGKPIMFFTARWRCLSHNGVVIFPRSSGFTIHESAIRTPRRDPRADSAD